MNTLPVPKAIEQGKKVAAIRISQTLSKTVYVAIDADKELTEATNTALEQLALGMITLSGTDLPSNSCTLLKTITKDNFQEYSDTLLDKTALVKE